MFQCNYIARFRIEFYIVFLLLSFLSYTVTVNQLMDEYCSFQDPCFHRLCIGLHELMTFVVVQSLNLCPSLVIPWTIARQASLSFTISWSLFKLMSIEKVMPSNHLVLSSPSHPAFFPSIRVFSCESALCIRWPKYFSFSISPSNEYSGLISFRIDWFDLLAVWETLKSLFQHHSSKASVIQCSTFFMVQLSHPYMTTGKTMALTNELLLAK